MEYAKQKKFDEQNFDHSGPSHLTSIDWQNTEHQKSVAACLVQGVYVVEQDRQRKRAGLKALAPPWWEFFHFKLRRKLMDVDGSSIFGVGPSIFGVIYEFNSPVEGIPRFVIAFRGTLLKERTMSRDLHLNLKVLLNRLHQEPSFKIAMEAVKNMVDAEGYSNVWLAGHSLGSAMAMLAGKTMASNGFFLKSSLFNPPFVSAPIEMIKYKTVRDVLRISRSLCKAGLYPFTKAKQQLQERSHFTTLSAWFPSLFVNPADVICSEYIGYFRHRKTMQYIGLEAIEMIATQHSFVELLKSARRKQPAPEPTLHLIPSAILTVNLTPSQGFNEAHRICQWWSDDQQLQSDVHEFI